MQPAPRDGNGRRRRYCATSHRHRSCFGRNPSESHEALGAGADSGLPDMGYFVREVNEEHGVRFHLGDTVIAINPLRPRATASRRPTSLSSASGCARGWIWPKKQVLRSAAGPRRKPGRWVPSHDEEASDFEDQPRRGGRQLAEFLDRRPATRRDQCIRRRPELAPCLSCAHPKIAIIGIDHENAWQRLICKKIQEPRLGDHLFWLKLERVLAPSRFSAKPFALRDSPSKGLQKRSPRMKGGRFRFDEQRDDRFGLGLTGNAAAVEIARRAERSSPTMLITGGTGEESLIEPDAQRVRHSTPLEQVWDYIRPECGAVRADRSGLSVSGDATRQRFRKRSLVERAIHFARRVRHDRADHLHPDFCLEMSAGTFPAAPMGSPPRCWR